jgi:cytochrome P450
MSSSSSGAWSWLFALPMLAKQGRSALLEGSSSLSSWYVLLALAAISLSAVVVCWLGPGGSAWGSLKRRNTIPGPRGVPVLGSLMEMGGLAHRRLAQLAQQHGALSLMSLSLGKTRVVIASKPDTARDILCSSSFANRPLKQSAQQLLFGRAIGFAPQGDYWRGLRRIAANHLFAPKRIAAHEASRQFETNQVLLSIAKESSVTPGGAIQIRSYLQRASLNNIMSGVFGRRYDFDTQYCTEAVQLKQMVREGFELLGAFNWADHLPALDAVDPQNIHQRCAKLVPRVTAFVQNIIDEHRAARAAASETSSEVSDFVDVLLSLQGEEKLSDADAVAVLWEMIFRGTDTTAILTEWIMAELVLHPEIQAKLHSELDAVVGRHREVRDADIAHMPYLQAVVKETLRTHPPGPLLSWARLSTEDVQVGGHLVPKGTTAMVNMWAIAHDPTIWANPHNFCPERFLPLEGGMDFDVRGSDLRLAPFGAGRRVCPGRALGMTTVQLWLAQLLHKFEWVASTDHPVDLSEVLKLSCEMVHPLHAIPIPRMIMDLNI